MDVLLTTWDMKQEGGVVADKQISHNLMEWQRMRAHAAHGSCSLLHSYLYFLIQMFDNFIRIHIRSHANTNLGLVEKEFYILSIPL